MKAFGLDGSKVKEDRVGSEPRGPSETVFMV